MSKRTTTTTRRIFIARALAGGTAIVALRAGAQAKVDEKDPQAAALGYVADTARADEKKYSKHGKDQKCANCQLFQGKAGDAAGNCPLFAGKQVLAGAWCSAYTKKTG
jgi:hypothetical protein